MSRDTSSWRNRVTNFPGRRAEAPAEPELRDALDQRLLEGIFWIFWTLLGVFVVTMLFYESELSFGELGGVLSGLLGVSDMPNQAQNSRF